MVAIGVSFPSGPLPAFQMRRGIDSLKISGRDRLSVPHYRPINAAARSTS